MIDSYLLYKDKLKGEYHETFNQVEFYCETLGMDRCLIEERLNELMDVFISAQESEKPIEKIVGKDINSFCKSFCSDIGFKNRATNFFDHFKNVVWYVLIFSILNLIVDISELPQGETLSIWSADGVVADGFIIWGAVLTVCSAICNAFIVWIMDKFHIAPTKTKRVIYWIVSFLLVGVLIYFIFEENSSSTVPVGYLLSFCSIYLVAYYSLNHKRLAARKANKVKFWDTVEVDTDTKTLVKAFNKKNRRLERKGKPCLSRDEFLEKTENDLKNSEKSRFMYFLFPIALTVMSGISMEFDTIFDVILYSVIMLTVQGFIMYFLYKCTQKAEKSRRAEIELLRNNPELWDE